MVDFWIGAFFPDIFLHNIQLSILHHCTSMPYSPPLILPQLTSSNQVPSPHSVHAYCPAQALYWISLFFLERHHILFMSHLHLALLELQQLFVHIVYTYPAIFFLQFFFNKLVAFIITIFCRIVGCGGCC